MKRVRLVVLCIAVAVIPAPSSAAEGLLVDAGPTQRVPSGTPFLLEAHVEGATEAAQTSWSLPAGCTAPETSGLVIAATCEPGLHFFSAAVLDGSETADDGVGIVVVHEYVLRTEASGETGLTVPDGSGEVEVPFEVPAAAVQADVSLDWTTTAFADFDLGLRRPDGDEERTLNSLTSKPEVETVEPIVPGIWTAIVRPKTVLEASWTLRADVSVVEGDHPVPELTVPSATAAEGDVVTLAAEVSDGTEPYGISWETTPGSWAFDDGSGSSLSFTFAGTTAVIRAKLTDGAGLESIATALVRDTGSVTDRPVTIIGVIDSGFSPYHFDFLGSQHPWNVDADPANDFDFTIDPAASIEGFPGATPIQLTLPTSGGEVVTGREAGPDAAAWSDFATSSSSQVSMYWFPGTKIVGAVSFDGAFFGSNDAHGTRSAASAGGNIHGTCPECLFVLIKGSEPESQAWAASQPWIDIVTNSYGHCLSGCFVRDNVYLGAPTAATRAAVEAGKVIVFSAGNGLANAFDVPMSTYTTGEKGPDWIVTVGANSPANDQNYLGSGKPVDISSVGSAYPSSGGGTANGTGTHSGTSNAAPVTAGTFAKVLHEARELLGDATSGYAGGVVASGAPVPCGEAVPACALGDGVLTREELQSLVYTNVLPAPQAIGAQVVPTTQHAYYYQGHGALIGRLRGSDVWNDEWGRMIANARGEIAGSTRPAGERNWFTVDSKCRQRFWGSWSGGYYRGVEPVLDPQADPLAWTFDRWCSQVPQDLLGPR